MADAPDLGSGPERGGGSSPLARTTPEHDEFSTRRDHGFTAEPRAFLRSRTRFEPNTFCARTFFSLREPDTAILPVFLASSIHFARGSSQPFLPFTSAEHCSSN